jgi:GntR family transcriptional regulator, transcriptional repressor for pyruvate dehydrogenase complex
MMQPTMVLPQRPDAPGAPPTVRRQLRQPRLSEIVAEELRQRILSHELADGAMLPRQEDLLAEFGVSVPSLREAMRILETEGFITVRRGSIGGAVVHLPKPVDAAYTFGLVLESHQVGLNDVMAAMQWLEPVCAASCAVRRDRKRVVLPALRAAIKESVDLLDDPVAYGMAARGFHDAIVANCGNETVRLMVGALELLWKAQVRELRLEGDAGVLPDRSMREESVATHRRMAAAIEQGDGPAAEAIAREHFSDRSLQRVYAGGTTAVRAVLLRDR